LAILAANFGSATAGESSARAAGSSNHHSAEHSSQQRRPVELDHVAGTAASWAAVSDSSTGWVQSRSARSHNQHGCHQDWAATQRLCSCRSCACSSSALSPAGGQHVSRALTAEDFLTAPTLVMP
jgi:hypothetical protein